MDIGTIVIMGLICTMIGYLAGVYTMDIFQKATQKRGQASIGPTEAKIPVRQRPFTISAVVTEEDIIKAKAAMVLRGLQWRGIRKEGEQQGDGDL